MALRSLLFDECVVRREYTRNTVREIRTCKMWAQLLRLKNFVILMEFSPKWGMLIIEAISQFSEARITGFQIFVFHSYIH